LQSVAPQGPPATHWLAQQWKPTPEGPQIMLWQSESIEHGAPSPPEVVPEEVALADEVDGLTHELNWQTYPVTQSVVVLHDVLHDMVSAHTRLPAHGIVPP
jgi:hypothetical protein